MLNSLEDTLNKTCLLGLSYFNVAGDQLKQTILAGTVIAVDKEIGITIQLLQHKEAKKSKANFILPTNLACWFNAPQGDFHTSTQGVKITNPDYLVTWDIYQTKEDQSAIKATKHSQDSEQQWWQWRPRTEPPKIG
ncbi:MAG: hypothetical protein MJK12_03545 [Colwellia sp.]|nr:hypothetical protein [Colwellia sp.]